MFYVVTDNCVYSGKNLNDIQKKTNGKFDLPEFKVCGPDSIAVLTQKDLLFVQDKNRLSMIPIERLAKKDTTSKNMMIIILVLSVISVIRG
jgi:hypothetical protein